jgi:hypothetical protein
MSSRTYYTVHSYVLRDWGTWSPMGSGPGGRTLEEARERVRRDICRAQEVGSDMEKIKFEIHKHVDTEVVAEQVLGNECSFFMLRVE